MKKYFDIHVTIIPGKESFSTPVEIDIHDDYMQEEVISVASDMELIDSDDVPYVDDVREIDLDEYKEMKGIK